MKKEYDYINPSHYKQFPVESIEFMVLVFGKKWTAIFCLLSAFKYQMRIGLKPEQSYERERAKIDWYMNTIEVIYGMDKLKSKLKCKEKLNQLFKR